MILPAHALMDPGTNFDPAAASHRNGSPISSQEVPMKARWKLPAVVMAAAGAFAAPAIAADVVEIRTAPTTTYYYTSPAGTEYYYDPVSRTYHYYRIDSATPPIIVEAPPLTEDEAITNDVVASLASDPRLDEGQIGVETFRNEVTLTGRVGTLRHVDIAENRAATVPGVREVHNHLRPGGMRLLTR
jgi:hypothetical protein